MAKISLLPKGVLSPLQFDVPTLFLDGIGDGLCTGRVQVSDDDFGPISSANSWYVRIGLKIPSTQKARLPMSRKSQRDLFPNPARSAWIVCFINRLWLYSLYLLRDLTHQ